MELAQIQMKQWMDGGMHKPEMDSLLNAINLLNAEKESVKDSLRGQAYLEREINGVKFLLSQYYSDTFPVHYKVQYDNHLGYQDLEKGFIRLGFPAHYDIERDEYKVVVNPKEVIGFTPRNPAEQQFKESITRYLEAVHYGQI